MKNTKKIISKILIYFALILGVLFCLVPLYWMIRSSLMNTVEVFMMPPRWIPSKFMWENYQEVFDTLPFGKYFLNSFIEKLDHYRRSLQQRFCIWGGALEAGCF